MKKPHIILVDDQKDVLSTLMQDLTVFRGKFILDDCQSAQEASKLLEELEAGGEPTALILADHIMPNISGIEFLSGLSEKDGLEHTRKVLITGQASHSDTINAINNAAIDYYISKPWVLEDLHAVVKKMITLWVLDSGLNHQGYSPFIDTKVLFQRLKNEAGTKY
jgi:two-component system chemotaxis response regulator CheY